MRSASASSRFFSAAASASALALADAVDLLFHPRDQVLEARRLLGERLGPRLLVGEGGNRPGVILLSFFNQKLHAGAFFGEDGGVGTKPVALPFHLGAERQELAEIGGELVGGLPEIGDHGAEEDRAPNRGQRVLGANEDRRRRPVADPLQRRQHLDQHLAPLEERASGAPLRSG